MRRICFAALAVIALSIGLEAKGTTVKLTLTGPGLAAPAEIVEPAILDRSNVWEGSFLGEVLDTAPGGTPPTFSLNFVVQTPLWMRQPPRTMYTVLLVRDAKSGGLLLYLPGRGESGYQLNVSTMLRDMHDGHWHRPPAAWASAIAVYLPRARTD